MVRAWPGSSSLIHVRSTDANRSASACARIIPPGPLASRSAAANIHCCERTASAFSAMAIPGSRRHERSSERTASLRGSRISSRRMSTSNNRSRADSSAMSGSRAASTLRSVSFTWAATMASFDPKPARSSESERLARPAISPNPIWSIGFCARRSMNASMIRSRTDLVSSVAMLLATRARLWGERALRAIAVSRHLSCASI